MKILKTNIKREYELTVLLPGSFTDAEATATKKSLEESIKKLAGKIISQADWGKKAMAYKIKAGGKLHQEAYYAHWVVEFSPEAVKEFRRVLQLESKVIRYLLVIAEKGKRAVQPSTPEETESEE